MIEYNKVVLCDYNKLISETPDESVDMVFIDPPYWTLNKWRNVGTTTRLGGNGDKNKQIGWFETISQDDLFYLMHDLYRVLKQDTHAFIMCDGQILKYVLGYAEEAGYSYYKPIVWDKVLAGMGYHLRCQHEYVVMLDKGKNKMPKDRSITDVIRIKMIRGGYPTEKPIALPKLFIENYTDQNDVVMDCFCGSGSTALACLETGRKFLTCDISENAIEYANKRIYDYEHREKGLFE